MNRVNRIDEFLAFKARMESEKLSDEIFLNFCGLIVLIVVILFTGSAAHLNWTEDNGAFAVIICGPLEMFFLVYLYTTIKSLISLFKEKKELKNRI